MDARALLIVDPSYELLALAPLIRANGWELYDLTQPRQRAEMPPSASPLVGIYGFQPDNLADSAPFEDLGRRFRVEWIGLTQSDFLANHDHRHLLANYCLDYHTRPIEAGRLLQSIGHAHGMADLAGDDNPVQTPEQPLIDEMIGVSAPMLGLYHDIRKVASVDASVLIAGESGTGKELIARAIHQRSQRRNGPFVAVNCGALPATLIQAELFGYEKGAFTGAQQRKIGLVESAHRGTLLLDEIADLPLDLQSNFLRFLQERAITRVGSTASVPVDVRVLAASHTDLEAAVKTGRFREDLYYRLNVIRLSAPPLRERPEDIELLARYFLDLFVRKRGARARRLSAQALAALKAHSWPGNVRELINRVRRAEVMAEQRLIRPDDLGLATGSMTASRSRRLNEVKASVECDALLSALKSTGNNVSQAARTLGVSRVSFYRLLNKHGIKPR